MIQSWISEAERPAYRWVNYDDISDYMALAAIIGEDHRFADHKGFDMYEIRDAIAGYRAGEGLRGASTISQQTAKNLYLWPRQSVFRKLLEAWFTVLIEFSWPKERILEVYLNVAQFDDNLFGVETASQKFFEKGADELKINEAARLAAVLPAPTQYCVDNPSDYVLSRQDDIIHHIIRVGGSTSSNLDM